MNAVKQFIDRLEDQGKQLALKDGTLSIINNGVLIEDWQSELSPGESSWIKDHLSEIMQAIEKKQPGNRGNTSVESNAQGLTTQDKSSIQHQIHQVDTCFNGKYKAYLAELVNDSREDIIHYYRHAQAKDICIFNLLIIDLNLSGRIDEAEMKALLKPDDPNVSHLTGGGS